MWTFQQKDVQISNRLSEAFGDDVELIDEQDESIVYRILSEFRLGDQAYAVLQSEEESPEDDYEIFRITMNEDGTPELETIEDDDEWDNVAELYDEMTYAEEENE